MPAAAACSSQHTTAPHPAARQALHHAKAALHQMADQHKDLEQRRRANLAFSGQTLVGDNLGVLQVGPRSAAQWVAVACLWDGGWQEAQRRSELAWGGGGAGVR